MVAKRFLKFLSAAANFKRKTNAMNEEITEMQKAAWKESQEFELDFWANQWATLFVEKNGRKLTIDEIIEERQKAGIWLLNNFEIPLRDDSSGEIFSGDVLEVGCGPVGFFEKFSNVKVHGIDPLMEEYASRLYFSTLGQRNNYIYSSAHIKDIKANEYDWIVCSNVLDHTENYEFILKELLRVANKRATILLVTDCRETPEKGHTQTFTPGQVVDDVIKQKYHIERCKIGHPLHADEEAVGLFLQAKYRQ